VEHAYWVSNNALRKMLSVVKRSLGLLCEVPRRLLWRGQLWLERAVVMEKEMQSRNYFIAPHIW